MITAEQISSYSLLIGYYYTPHEDPMLEQLPNSIDFPAYSTAIAIRRFAVFSATYQHFPDSYPLTCLPQSFPSKQEMDWFRAQLYDRPKGWGRPDFSTSWLTTLLTFRLLSNLPVPSWTREHFTSIEKSAWFHRDNCHLLSQLTKETD